MRNLVTLDVCLATRRSVSPAVLSGWAAVIGGGEWMDAERVAGYHGTGFREATGREKEAGRHGPTGKRGAPTAPFPTVPEQRGGPGEIGRSGDSADIGGAADRGSVSVSRSTEPFEVVFDSEDPPAPGPSGVNGDAPGIARVDVRWEPLAVRDGCRPDRIPDGRWPSDGALVRSEQFVVNEAVAQPGGGVFAVHAPPGTGVAEVYGDLVAAIITERARRIADLPGPAAAFGELRTWSTHRVAAPNRILTGFEIVLAAPESSALTAHGLPPIGAGWREAATTIDYFASTARLADGVGAWAMLAARLGDGAANRAFAERWWRGAVRGTDVLFPAGESMAAALRRLQAESAAVDWQGAVARFRSALAKTEKLASERSEVAAAVTRISDLEQACEEASCSAEAAQARLADLAARRTRCPRGAYRRRGGTAGAAGRPRGAPAQPARVHHRDRRRQDGAPVSQRAVDRAGRRGSPRPELARLDRAATRAARRLRRGGAATGSGREGTADAERQPGGRLDRRQRRDGRGHPAHGRDRPAGRGGRARPAAVGRPRTRRAGPGRDRGRGADRVAGNLRPVGRRGVRGEPG